MGIIKTYKTNLTSNNLVNSEKLNYEIKTSAISFPANAYELGDKIHVEFETTEEIGETNMSYLDDIIFAHDGAPAAVTQDKVDKRELGIRELVQMAFYHPFLDENITTGFLTEIDNAINAFIRSGNYTVLIGLIAGKGADESDAYHDYLNITINTAGNKTWEFFISRIMSI